MFVSDPKTIRFKPNSLSFTPVLDGKKKLETGCV